MSFLFKPFPYISSLKKNILVGFILGGFLAFIIIVLQPFNTNEFQSNYKNLLLSGFGIVFFISYVLYTSFENIIYSINNKKWSLAYEVFSIISFFILAGSTIYFYNRLVVNGLDYSIESHLRYYKRIVIGFIPIFGPILIYLRHKFGKTFVPEPNNTFTITGENKNEILKLKRGHLLYIKAEENYIEITYLNENLKKESKTFRQTLTNAKKQVPFLEKCHRSYLVNMEVAKDLKGNSQNAKIVFNGVDEAIPLSKTHYKEIKRMLRSA